MTVAKAIEYLRAGKPILVFDHSDRENEYDFFLPVENATVETLNFINRNGGGLLCVSLSHEIGRAKGVPLMPKLGHDPMGTAFTLSLDSKRGTTGISMQDRLYTGQDLLNSDINFSEFLSPGHIFPLIAHSEGLWKRRGHTEAATMICKLAGLQEACFIVEVLGENGETIKSGEMEAFACKNDVPIVCIADLVEYMRININCNTVFLP